jgi:cell division protein FtsQ
MKQLKNIAPWLILLLYVVLALSFISAQRKAVICNKVAVNITDGTSNFFIEEQDVIKMLNDKGEKLVGQPIDAINVNFLEDYFKGNPLVKEANVYRTIGGELNVSISQRKPILRVINSKNESFYIDDEGSAMPLSTKYTAHVLVASGQIKLSYAQLKAAKNKTDKAITVDNSQQQFLDLLKLASYIYHDQFWRAQIEQIYVNNGEFELIPRVGTHLIEFGGTDNMEKKFRNLKALYQQGLSVTGWNNYSKINLKYNQQVICTKR